MDCERAIVDPLASPRDDVVPPRIRERLKFPRRDAQAESGREHSGSTASVNCTMPATEREANA